MLFRKKHWQKIYFLEKSVRKKYTFYRKNAYGVLKKCLKMFFLFNVFLIKLFSKKFKEFKNI
jgi:hypothetical protein